MDNPISVQTFYGKNTYKRKGNDSLVQPVIPYKCQSLLNGPTLTWKVFKRQADALDFMRKSGFGLMTFAFQTGETRLFLVAHPEVFWHYDIQRTGDQRCSYEVIPEGSVCKLYLDLEYLKMENPDKDENIILDSFIQIICYFLNRIFSIQCDRVNIITLDSSTPVKFSAHVIFDIPSVCFIDNNNAGNFIKYICSEVITSYEEGALTEPLVSGPLDINAIKNFIVKDSKGATKLFCDECVYSKNRHFRLYKSTKKGKNSPLILLRNCTYRSNEDKYIFLSSLISYVVGSESTKVIQFGECSLSKEKHFNKDDSKRVDHFTSSSSFPRVDEFIKSLISPSGRIYRSVYFSTSNVIVYDITGYRYCGNIKREHKSNNVKYIVDLAACHYYQKCYDYECSNFRSDRMDLPYDVSFSLSDNSDLTGGDNVGVFDLTTTVDILSAIEDAALDPTFSQEIKPHQNFIQFPSFGIPDESFSELADMLDS